MTNLILANSIVALQPFIAKIYLQDALFKDDELPHNSPDEDARRSSPIELGYSSPTPQQTLEDEQERSVLLPRLRAVLYKLDARSRDIVVRRWVAEEKATLRELVESYGVSAERIRQIELCAIKQLRNLYSALETS